MHAYSYTFHTCKKWVGFTTVPPSPGGEVYGKYTDHLWEINRHSVEDT